MLPSPSLGRHAAAAPAEMITAQTGPANSRRNEKRSKSKVWKKFKPVLRRGEVKGAECKQCEKILRGKGKGGTSHLRRHLKICPAPPTTSRMEEQQSSPQQHPDPSTESNPMPDQDKSLDLLTRALVSNLCSFSTMVNDMNFREFLAGICPTHGMISQSAIEDKFQSIFQSEKQKLREEIALAPGGVFLAVARWGLKSKYFACVTAQFVDKDWKLVRRIIRCRFAGVDYNSQYDYIGMLSDSQSYTDMIVWYDDMEDHAEDIINEVVKDWRLEGKLLGISLPNSMVNQDLSGRQKSLAEENYLLVKNKLLSLPCIIDSLHGLFDSFKPESVQRISEEWFKYMTCSRQRTERYKQILSQLRTKRPSFGSQKWHLTLYILEAALQFNRVLPNPTRIDSRFYPSKPSNEKLQAVENFCNLARFIYHTIEVVSNPSSGMNSHFHKILSLKLDLMSSFRRSNMSQVFDLEKMKEKFDELWRHWYLWLSLAVVLDPRYKFRSLALSLEEAFGSDDAKRYKLEVRGKMYELFTRYSFHTTDVQLDDEQGHGTSENYSEQSTHEKMGELFLYLEGERIPEDASFDIMKWWKGNASTYPTLARLARDILAILGSAVSAESALDETDERMSLFNWKLSPELVEALICTQDWIKFSSTAPSSTSSSPSSK